MDEQLAADIALYGEEKAYDQICKKFLSYKEVLAFIMKHCVDEYKDCTVKEIEGYIEGTPEVSSAAVMPDQTNRITGDNVEDGSATEGTIWYDIRFHASVPNEVGSIGLIINIEAQSQEKPSYPLVKRGIYYCARLLSSQYGKDFIKGHYERIKKVYSIWICTDTAEKRKNSILAYDIRETVISGGEDSVEEKRHYDMLKLMMIALGDETKTEQELLRFLDTLFSQEMTKEDKINNLETEFAFEVTDAMKGDVDRMCNLSYGVLSRGRKEGRAEGRAEGIEHGYKVLAQSILGLMDTTGWQFEQAADAMKVTAEDREMCRKLLSLPS